MSADQERDADPFWDWWQAQRVQEGEPVYSAQTEYWARAAWHAALASVQPDDRWIAGEEAGYQAALAGVADRLLDHLSHCTKPDCCVVRFAAQAPPRKTPA